jgi:acetoin utilization deacetylase AcuC-like enzyme
MVRMAGSFLKTGLVSHPAYREHDPGEGHPESPSRYDAALRGIADAVPQERIQALDPRPATEDEIAFCHSRRYIETVKADVEEGFECLSTGDTNINEHSLAAALMAAGGVMMAVDAVVAGQVKNAFCAVRPPGHHATTHCGMGFCVFNNVALGARYAQKKYGIHRVLIVDWDIHHGNGTQEIFYSDPTVFYFSTHQWPFYPGTGMSDDVGTGEGKGFTLNCPFASGSGRTEIVGAFQERLLPAMKKFKPEFVFISAGFDGRIADPIGQFVLLDKDFAELTDIVMGIAAEHAEGRLVSALEGGYELRGLASSVGAHVARLAGVTSESMRT